LEAGSIEPAIDAGKDAGRQRQTRLRGVEARIVAAPGGQNLPRIGRAVDAALVLPDPSVPFPSRATMLG
jgi:hypothetical protein